MNKPLIYFTDKESLRTIDTFRISYLIIAIISFFLTEVGRHVYRPYIYGNNINDFGIADSIGNLGGIIVQLFFTLAILNPRNRKVLNVFVFIIIGYIFYEIIQPILPKGTFDWKDIYGTVIGGFISFLVWLIINKFFKNRTIRKF